jgi:hypothetical protein
MSKKSNYVKVSAKQGKGIECLLTQPTIKAAADCAGVTRQTMHNWLNDDRFKAALDTAQREALQAATRRLASMLDRSVSEVERLIEAGEDEPVRLRAALSVPSMLRDLREHDEFEERLTALEAKL